MKKVNDNPSSPLKFVTDDGVIIGQFYNSYDKMHHLAEYIPYRLPPSKRLCGKMGENFSPSKEDGKNRTRLMCPGCRDVLMTLTDDADIWS